MEIDKHERQKKIIALQYEAMELENEDQTKKLVYENQSHTSLKIINLFLNNIIAVSLIAQPQVGKTGCILSLLIEFCRNDTIRANKDDIYVITGMSDIDWEVQTKNSFLPLFRDNVIHRSNLYKYTDKLKSMTNGLICIDESHFGAGKLHTVSKQLKSAGLLNIDLLRTNNIKILFVSATPGATLDDVIISMNEYHQKVILNPPSSYVGFSKLIEYGNIIETEELDCNNISSICDIINNRWGDNYKFHILRITNKEYNNVFRLLHKYNNDNHKLFTIIEHNSNDRQKKDFLDKKPDEHTFVFIKGFWRASKQLNDANVGVAYESPKIKPDTNTTAQGLAARLLGNDKQQPSETSPLIFTHISSLKEYLKLVHVKADYSQIDKFTSSTLKIKHGIVTKKQKTLAHESNFNDNYVDQPSIHNYISDFIEFENVDLLNTEAKRLSKRSHQTKPNSYLKNGIYCNNIPGYENTKCSLNDALKLITGYKPESLLNKKQMDNNIISKVVLPCYNENDEVIWILRYGCSLNNPNLDKNGLDDDKINQLINTKKYRLDILGEDKIKIVYFD